METLLQKYDRLLIFDTETTGLHPHIDEIIEFAAAAVELREGKAQVVETYDELISLSPLGFLPARIQELTGITPQDLRERGLSKTRVAQDIARLIRGNTLLLAYNAQFDLSFLYFFLLRDGDVTLLQGKDKLDLLTVYRDRRSYPHKLRDAIEAYGLSGQVVNSHRAVDDVLATVAVMEAMAKEKDDFTRYVNLFGYYPKYGPPKRPIRSITYRPQYFDPSAPLYEALEESHV